MIRILAFLAALVAFLLPAVAGASPSELEAEIRAILERHRATGAFVVVVEDGAPILRLLYGMADVEAGRPVTEETLFRVGSVSKNLTSLLAVKLASEGRITLDQPVPESLGIRQRDPSGEPVRLVHLLEHTGGIPGSNFREYATSIPNVAPADYAAMQGGRLVTRWPAGRFFAYANPGHTIAAAMLEKATGRDFDTLIEEDLFRPLGMHSASFRLTEANRPKLAASYAKGVRQSVWELPNRPSGSLLATMDDMAALVAFYAADGAGLVSAPWIRRMLAPHTTLAAARADGGHALEGAYGLGMFGFSVEDRIMFGHWGSIDSFRTNMGFIPGFGRGFALSLNDGNPALAADLRKAIARYIFRDTPPAPLPQGIQTDLRAWSGMYQAFTHDMPRRAWIWETLGIVRISGGLGEVRLHPLFPIVSPSRFVAVDDWRLRPEASPLITAGLVQADGHAFAVGFAEETLRRISPVKAWSWALLAASVAALAIMSPLVLLMVAGIRLVRGQAATLPVALPLGLAGASLLLLVGIFVMTGILGTLSEVGALGRVSPQSLLLAALSMVFAAATLWSAKRLIGHWRQIPWHGRTYASVTTFLFLLALVFLAFERWIPLLTWR